jgi:hypothetical protein
MAKKKPSRSLDGYSCIIASSFCFYNGKASCKIGMHLAEQFSWQHNIFGRMFDVIASFGVVFLLNYVLGKGAVLLWWICLNFNCRTMTCNLLHP